MAAAAVVFDVDGTLVDHDGAARAGLADHLAGQGVVLDEPTWRRWRAEEERHFTRYLAGELSFQEQRRARAREFTGQSFDDSAADAWFDGFRVCFERSWQVFDDVAETLDRLDGLPLAAPTWRVGTPATSSGSWACSTGSRS